MAPDSIVTGIIGLLLLLEGIIVIIRAGFDGPMNDPVVNVAGFSHTATLGLVEIGFGLVLLVSAAAFSRSGEVFFGALLFIAGVVGAAQENTFDEELAMETGMAWLWIFAGVIIVLAAWLMPRVGRSSSRYMQD